VNILLAGRLGRYADRVLALSDRGHRLVYCTMPAPAQRPLPDDLKDDSIPRYVLSPSTARDHLTRLVDEHRIDVVYSMKNVWDGSLELVSELLDAGVCPVVRHYKEHFCRPSELERRSLVETAGQIYINEESLAYFRDSYGVDPSTAHILETDYLPALRGQHVHPDVPPGVVGIRRVADLEAECLGILPHRHRLVLQGRGRSRSGVRPRSGWCGVGQFRAAMSR
jgi:hypothetical protein